jgi:hypothetical protein
MIDREPVKVAALGIESERAVLSLRCQQFLTVCQSISRIPLLKPTGVIPARASTSEFGLLAAPLDLVR